jgi:hypothetical protein
VRQLLPSLALLLVASSCNGSGPVAARTPSPVPVTTGPTALPEDPLSPRPALESPAPRGQVTCSADTLTVTDADLLASGTSLEEVFAIRTRGAPCQLMGWPAVSLLDAADQPIPVTARRAGSSSTETLSRGTSLSFVLATPRSSTCQDVSTLVVRLPGTSHDLRAATTMQVCDGSLSVSAVQRRQDDEGAEH